MKLSKRKAKRIENRPVKKQSVKRYKSEKHPIGSYPDSYAGTEEELLNKIVKVIVKIIKKEVGLY